jgi:translation initiation factor IF-2
MERIPCILFFFSIPYFLFLLFLLLLSTFRFLSFLVSFLWPFANSMRLVQVAKALGMTGQQLRHELTSVDFGIKPTDREVPDNLAMGIVRVIARKHGITPDIDALGAFVSDEEAQEASPALPPPVAAAESPVAVSHSRSSADHLHVLRKLTLDDVPREAVHRQEQALTQGRKEQEKAHEERHHPPRPHVRRPAMHQEQIKKKEGMVLLPAQISVKEFAEKAGVQVPQVISALMKNGVLATITQSIDFDTAAIVAAELGVQVQREQSAASAEQLFSRNIEELIKDEPERLLPRPPIVVVMGHVDHGKTSLLDAIRQSNVAAQESGGITQHIGAYQVDHQGKTITFLDTPGHEAFTAMRARGAQITDIVILVVACDEGVKPTTIEAVNHAKEAKVPMLVALNKVDRPGADPERVKGELAGQGLQPEDWGGSVPMIPCSAVTAQGIDAILDHIILLAELHGCKANPNRPAVATVIESSLHPALGPVGTVIVNAGTLRTGDIFVCGRTTGKVRAMEDASGKKQEEILPSGAVRVAGFGAVPHVGDIFQVMPSEREARALLEQILEQAGSEQRYGFADLVRRLHEGKLVQLKVVLKADAQGSLEAIQHTLEKQATDQVTVKVIHGAIGAVSESDVMMASASGGMVMAFRVDVAPAVRKTAERESVRIREYDVIYTLFDEVQGLLQGLLEPDEKETIIGHLEVKGVFFTKKGEQIIGGRVLDGSIKRVFFRLKRGEQTIGSGRITSLRKVEKDIKEAKEGSECGLKVEGVDAVQLADVLEVFSREFKKRE